MPQKTCTQTYPRHWKGSTSSSSSSSVPLVPILCLIAGIGLVLAAVATYAQDKEPAQKPPADTAAKPLEIPPPPSIKQPPVDGSLPSPKSAETKTPPAPKLPISSGSIHHELAAVNTALADINSLPAIDRPFQRYVLVRGGTWQAVSLAWNMAALRGPEPVVPSQLAGGKVLRIDLRRYSVDDKSLSELINTWEELRFDPYFRQPAKIVVNVDNAGILFEVTGTGAVLNSDGTQTPLARGEVVKLVGRSEGGHHTVEHRGRRGWVKSEHLTRMGASSTKQAATDVVPAFHAGGTPELAGPANALQEATKIAGLLDKGSQAAIVDSRYLLVRSFSSLDIGFGEGLYYKFRGIKKSDDPKKTDFQILVDELGADLTLAAAGIGANAAALSNSGVTGRQRQIWVVRTKSQAPSRGQSMLYYTLDPSQENSAKADFDPIRNLANVKYDASEVIFDLESGLHGYALYDANQKLQERAPDTVVTDHMVPKPYCANLVSGISCLRCHSSGISENDGDGLLGFKNQIKELTAGGFDIIADLKIADQFKAISGFVRLYNFDPELDILPSGRKSFAVAVYKATRQESKKSCAEVAEMFDRYAHSVVGVEDALDDLGVKPAEGHKPADVFRALVTAVDSKDKGKLLVVDPVIGLLQIGQKVARLQWEQVYAEVAARSVASGFFQMPALKPKTE